MIHWEKRWSRGPCTECGTKFEREECHDGLCLICRQPPRAREMVRYGVLPQTAHILLEIADKCNGDADKVLRIVHPRVMENIKIVGKKFKIVDKRYRWIRRSEWMRAPGR